MVTKIGTILVVCGLLSGPVAADEGKLQLHFVSHHFAAEKYNEHNPGIGFISASNEAGWSMAAGVYKNSEFNQSTYVQAEKVWIKLPSLQGGVAVGAVSGYSYAVLQPYVLPFVNLGPVRATFAPWPVPVVGLSLNVKL